MTIRKVALIIFYDKKGRILLQDHHGISKHGVEWGYFGGKIEQGETPEEAVVRETKEELTFNLQNHQFIGVVTSADSVYGTIERHVFISPLPPLRQLHQKEGKGMQLFTLEEAKKLKSVFGDDKVVEKLEGMRIAEGVKR